VPRPFGTTGREIAPLALGAMNFGMATSPDESTDLTSAFAVGVEGLEPPTSAL